MQDLNDLVLNRGDWIIDNATSVGNDGRIVGTAVGPRGATGVLLTPRSLDRLRSPYATYTKILSGIINDAAGWEIVNGHLVWVGPGQGDPPRETFGSGLTAGQRDVLTAFCLNGLASLVQDRVARVEMEHLTRKLVADAASRMNSGSVGKSSLAAALPDRAQPRRPPLFESLRPRAPRRAGE